MVNVSYVIVREWTLLYTLPKREKAEAYGLQPSLLATGLTGTAA
jgi:hypothetical protein